MKRIRIVAVGLAMLCMATASALAQEKAPEKPTGTMRVEADHREFARQGGIVEWRMPAAGVEGFTTYWPDGFLVTTAKLKDGTLAHNLGTYRIDGDLWCQKMRVPVDSKESCARSYRTAENAYENWRADGTFGAYWQFRPKK
jgi:hypothetical protein